MARILTSGAGADPLRAADDTVPDISARFDKWSPDSVRLLQANARNRRYGGCDADHARPAR